MTQTIEQIMRAGRLVPFTEMEIQAAMEAVKVRQSKGADLLPGHPLLCSEFSDILMASQEGVFFFHSLYQLDCAFAFLKHDAGRKFFGGQRALFSSYIGSELFADSWTPGVSFKSWVLAITSLGNVYRGNGFQ